MSCLASSTAIAPWSCPLCGEANLCAMELERLTGQAQPACWCTQVQFDPRVFERLPAEARGLACICQRCAIQQQPG